MLGSDRITATAEAAELQRLSGVKGKRKLYGDQSGTE
jgi:hypothetical protein